MTKFKSKTYTDEQIEAIIAEYHESHKPITLFCKDRGHKPAYQTLKGWLDIAGKDAGEKTTKAPATKAAPTTLAGMREEMERQEKLLMKQRQDYKVLLENEVTRLKAELEEAELELLQYEETN